ncbi:MAG TPA: ABC transporter permease subunit [Clostridia bacterium]
MTKTKKRYSFVYVILGVMFLLVLWTIAQRAINNDLVIPDIPSVLIALVSLLKQAKTYSLVFKTIGRLVLTICACAGLTLVLSYLSYKLDWFENFIKPLFVLMRTIPVVSLIIFLLFLLGREISPYFITGFVVLPVMYEGALSGFWAIDSAIKDEIKLFSKVNFKVVFFVFIPVTLPYLIAAFIQSFGLGLKVMVMAEFIAQPKGTIGYAMLQDRAYLNMANIFAWTIIMLVIVFLVEILVKTIRKKYI